VKILFFAQNLAVGGATRQIALQGEALQSRGHSISVVGLHELETEWRAWWPEALAPAHGLLQRPNRSRARELVALLGAARRLRKRVRREQVDVLYAFHGSLARFVGWLATYGTPTALVWGVRGAGRRHSLRRGAIALPLYACRAVSGFVPLLIANSEAGRESRIAGGFRCRRSVVVPNGFDTETFRPDAGGRARVRGEWGVAREPVVGLVGRVQPEHKRQNVFLAAAAIVARAFPDARWAIVGDAAPRDRAQMERAAERAGLAGRIIWTGFRADMPAVYNALDILCSASWHEGFPNVVGEAMACGVPCVVTDVGASAEIVGESGIVVPVDDADRLATGIVAMLRRLPDVRPSDVRAGSSNGSAWSGARRRRNAS
jgi:glycosyltransferase involved in cell wall biosynthesis